MRSTTKARQLSPAPLVTTATALFARLRAFAGSLVRDWQQARADRAGRIALAQLDAATLRDLGLHVNAGERSDIWPAARWTSRHLNRYL
jgi:DNA-binding transcriptional regulator/RsmH inhibitor MraZ